MRGYFVFFLFCGLAMSSLGSLGQQTQNGCALNEPPLRTNHPNIFSDEQEQWLGEAQASQQEPAYDLLPEKDSAELDHIGQKLLAQLPPTPIHYSFRVYESDDANGFSLAGGHVYISRKLITDAHSEDEVAGVLAHEVGHIYTKQQAAGFTRDLKAMLNVTSLGGREDVEDKAQLLLNAPRKERADESEDDEEKRELLADRVGVYALIKAGYAPKAFSENLDRIAANKGKTGNLLTDVLGATDPVSRRVRVARKIAATLPESCGKREPGSSEEFKAFQQAVRSSAIHPLIQPTPGLSSTDLEPAMRQSLEQVRFSPDGKLVLAQDESTIHVLSRSPLKRLFTIDARGAEPAHFTPDSSHIVFHYPNMRVEKWSTSTGVRESYHELVDFEGCMQTSLSPDGRTFACMSLSSSGIWVKLSDVESGKLFYDEKNYFAGLHSSDIIVRRGGGKRLGTVVYSQDGQTMLILVGTQGLAFDLKERKQISLGGDLAHMVDGRTAFVDSRNLVFQCDWTESQTSSKDTFKLCESSFPDGRPVNSFRVGYQWIEPVAKGNHILIGPFKDNAAMLTDPSTGKASAGFKLDSLDVYDQTLASESEDGGLTVGELGGPHMDSVELPISPMADFAAAAFSPDGRFLAYSGRARSSIWDLTTGKRVALMRPFRGARFDDQDQMFAQYHGSNHRPGQNFHIDLKTGKAASGATYAIDQFQHGDVLVTYEPLDKSGETGSNIVMHVADLATGAELWKKRFPHDAPWVRESEDGTLTLRIEMNSDTAVDEIRHSGGKLVKTSDWKNEWVSLGLLIEVVDSHTGEVRRMVQVPESYRAGNGDTREAVQYGDYLVIRGIYNNSVIYRISDGMRLGAFYGRVVAGDAKLGLLAATNRDQEITIYEAANGKRLIQVVLDQIPVAARFIAQKHELLALTASQHVYSIKLPDTGHLDAREAK